MLSMDFDTSSHFWGNEKSNQWYVIYATAADVDTTFALKAMPLMRYSSQGSQVITLRNNANGADIGYGFTTDELQERQDPDPHRDLQRPDPDHHGQQQR